MLGLLVGILAVSTASLFIRYAQEEASSLVIAAYRMALASLALSVPVLRSQGNEFRRLARRDLWLIMLSGVFLSLHFASWITSLEYTSVASSVILVTTTPLWVGLLSPLVLKEPLTRPVLIGMAMALLGSTVVGLGDACTWQGGLSCPPLADFVRGSAILGDFLALMGAWMAAGYLLIGRQVREKLSLWSYILGVYSLAAVVLAAWAALAGQRFLAYRPQTYLWFAALALVPQLVGHSTFNWALRYLPAAYVSVTLLGEPLGSTALAYVFLREIPGALTLFGSALILCGLLAASWPQPAIPADDALSHV